MKNWLPIGACVISFFAVWCAPLAALEVQHVTVYHEPGRFGGWPANHGMWIWGNELLVGFSAGYYKDNGPNYHAIDHDKPEEHLLARSLDGGLTWTIENPGRAGRTDSARRRAARHRAAARHRPAVDRLSRRHRLHASRFRHDAADDGQSRRPVAVLLFHRSRTQLARALSVFRCWGKRASPAAPTIW